MRRLHFETGMVAATLWAAWCFFRAPPDFLLDAARYHVVEQFIHHQRTVAWFCLIGAVLQCLGIALVKCRRCLGASDYLRMIGLALIGALWLVLGISFAIDGHDSVSAMLLIFAGIGSHGAMFLIARAPKWRYG